MIINVLRFILLCVLSQSCVSFASDVMQGPNSYWVCQAFDDTHHQWLAKSRIQQVAINQAYHACQKQSHHTHSCYSPKEYCDLMINGTKAQWQCMALDSAANVWKGGIYTSRHEAAINALDYCQARIGDTNDCYVNLLACKYLNDQ